MDLLSLINSDEHRAQAISELTNVLSRFAVGLTPQVDLTLIATSIVDGRYVGMTEEDIYTMAGINARPYTKLHYNYSIFCARIVLERDVFGDVHSVLGTSSAVPEGDLLPMALRHGKRTGQLDPRLLDGRFNLDMLSATVDSKHNDYYNLLAVQTLYDRYLMHDNGKRYETLQTMIMRVAMGLAVEEDNPTERAIEFYLLLANLDYLSSTPTLFNSGTKRPQLSSCYLTTIGDDLYDIYGSMRDNAMLSKWAGGLGNDWSHVRALNAHIHGTNGKSQGTVPFLKVANDTAVAVNQCFAPDTLLYKGDGTLGMISNVKVGDLVLGVAGKYREVTEVMRYEQKGDPMTAIDTLYSSGTVRVTSGHPFYAVAKGESEYKWVDAGELTTDHRIAYTIPKEIVPVDGVTPQQMEELGRDFLAGTDAGLPAEYKHLPLELTRAFIAGVFSNSQSQDHNHVRLTSSNTVGLTDVRYQLLRLGVPSALLTNLMIVPLINPVAEMLNRVAVDSETLGFNVTPDHVFVGVRTVSPGGPIPYVFDLKVEGDESYMIVDGMAHNGGKRKGAVCAYLTSWHLDIEEFLELRKNTGDDRRRTHDMNTANWIPDEFMRRVFAGEKWTLFTPDEVPELNDLYGPAFDKQYRYYEENAKALNLLHKQVEAKDLWRKMLSMLFETGHPWITFKDPCNIRSPQQHVGVVRSSNLCTEITLNTSDEEIAVCNLGSINLVKHIVNGKLDVERLARTIKTAVRMLDNVIDINYYPVDKARNSNLRHRPIGLGIMGFQDALYELNISYASQAAVDFADESMELVSYLAIRASADLARERGSYQTFDGSLWSQGKLPIDSLQDLIDARGPKYIEVNTSSKLGAEAWAELREYAKGGMRNSNVMAIAPTATISNIAGVSQSIEPTFENIFVKSNLSGEFTVNNRYLVDRLTALGLWSKDLAERIIKNNGSVKGIAEIPADVQELFPTAFEVDSRFLVDAASRRQKWIDQAQSLNLYIANASGKKLDLTYKMAWLRGLKTTYYLRAKGATSVESSTGKSSLNAVSATPVSGGAQAVPSACSLLDPTCEACQ